MSQRQRAVSIAIALAWTLTRIAGAQDAPVPMRLVATANDVGDDETHQNATIEIQIDRWSSAAERNALIGEFLSNGQNGLLGRLRGAPIKGRMRIADWRGLDPHQYRIGWDLRYAWHTIGPDGSAQIVLATDRMVGFGERRHQPGTESYPFSFLELRLTPEGSGEGKVSAAGRLSVDRNSGTLTIEDYSSEPAVLHGVRVGADRQEVR